MRNSILSLLSLVFFLVPFLAAAQEAPAADIPVFTRSLTIGSSGTDVTALQQLLKSRGYLQIDPTGYFGTLTAAAVAAFQLDNGLEPVGSVGPKTRGILNTASASASSPAQTQAVSQTAPQGSSGLIITRSLDLGSSGSDVTALQQFLQATGYYAYPTITGYYGPVTAQAVAAFQSAHALEPVGSVGPRTRAVFASIQTSTGISAASAPSNMQWLQPPAQASVPATPNNSSMVSSASVSSSGAGGGASSPAPDTKAPTISFITPTANQTISGSLLSSPVTITANASDSSGIASVQFLLDNASIGTPLTQAPYTTSINTSGKNNGAHTLTAVAKDTAGNYATTTIAITFANTWPNTPLIGAIRWDAWFATSTDATTSENFIETNYGVNASLFTNYTSRMPTYGWFDHGAVANEQAIMDQQILDAANHGLDYWSFDWYQQDNGTTTAELMRPFNDYMASQYHSKIKFTFMLSNTTASYWDSSEIPYLVSKFQDSQYLKTPDNRPIVFWFGANAINSSYVFGPNWRTELNNLTTADAAVGLGPPLFVSNNMDLTATQQYNFPAVTSYGSSGDGLSAQAAGHCYPEQVANEASNWSRTLNAGLQSVLGLSPVNDPRPRNYGFWVQQPTYTQWEQQVRNAYTTVSSASSNQVTNPRLILMYAWNEIDEGGPGIVPTVQEGTKYLDAINAVKSGVYPAAYTDTYNGDNCSIAYAGSSWFYNAPIDGYQNDEQVSTQNGDTATLSVASSTSFTITGIMGPNRGKMQVTIDSGTPNVVNLHAVATTTKQTLYSSGALTQGTHTVQISNVSDTPGQSWVGIDSIVVGKGR